MRAGAAGRRSHIITHGRCIPNMYLHVVADPVVMCVCVWPGPLTLAVWMNAVEGFFFTFFIVFVVLFFLFFFFFCYSTTALLLVSLH